MLKIRKTEEFARWIDELLDPMGRAKVQARIKRLAEGNPGNSKLVGNKVYKMKIDFGPGYRIYYTRQVNVLVILLLGGDKRSQVKDIELAKRLAKFL